MHVVFTLKMSFHVAFKFIIKDSSENHHQKTFLKNLTAAIFQSM
jgi:hypothetical protein